MIEMTSLIDDHISTHEVDKRYEKIQVKESLDPF